MLFRPCRLPISSPCLAPSRAFDPRQRNPRNDRELDAAIQSVITQQKTAAEAMKTAQQNALAELKRAGVKL